jgi:hypothetical protein
LFGRRVVIRPFRGPVRAWRNEERAFGAFRAPILAGGEAATARGERAPRAARMFRAGGAPKILDEGRGARFSRGRRSRGKELLAIST